jgi:hypothetical protein
MCDLSNCNKSEHGLSGFDMVNLCSDQKLQKVQHYKLKSYRFCDFIDQDIAFRLRVHRQDR